MVPKKASALVIAVFLLILALCRAPDILASVQTGYILDLEVMGFAFNESSFNDSEESQEYDFSGAGSATYWVSVPRNSSVSTFEMNLTGKIQYIYSETVNSPGLLGISIGNITTDTGNEIVTGSTKGEANVYALSGQDGSLIWTYNLSSQNNDIYSTAIGNVTGYPGNEVAFGAENSRVYVLNVDDTGATEAWNSIVTGFPKSVIIANITTDSPNEVVAGASRVYVYNETGGLICNSSGFTVNSLAEGNLSDDPGLEIAVASSDGYIRIINSSCSLVNSLDMGFTLNSIAVGNVTGDDYDEIAFGGADYSIYLYNSSLDNIWSYEANDVIKSVSIGDVVSQAPGNEVIAGSNDKKVYTINSSGSLVWDYLAEDFIESVAVGELTTDSGNEVAAGSGDGNLYAFNFDYFPSDVIIDVGANGTTDWQHQFALRGTVNVTGIESSVQYYLDNTCSQDMCQVPLEFESSHAGKLNVSGLNISYSYNTSGIMSVETLPGELSKTSWIMVNETIGSTSKNISFLGNSAQDVGVRYIRLPPAAGYCHFNGSTYPNETVGQDNTCDVPDFTLPQTGELPGPYLFWDSTMDSEVPIRGNETACWYTNTTDDFFSRKSIYVWNQSSAELTSIIVNVTVDDTSVRGQYYLNVSWQGEECNITPEQDHEACDSSSPTYSSLPCGNDTFQVCKKVDFFSAVQPYSNGTVMYTAGGSTNLPAGVSDPNVSLNESYWGDWFNYSLNVSDPEGNDVNVTLYYWLEHEDAWFTGPTVEVAGSGEAWFNMTSGKTWVGINKYRFGYQDFNSSGYPVHSLVNISEVSGPLAMKHETSISLVSGNNSVVNRTESVELVVAVNDLSAGGFAEEGTQCMVWVAYSGTDFDSGLSNVTDGSGYCRFWFTPDGNYTAGKQLWKAGVEGDEYYNNSNSTGSLWVNITGKANVSIMGPTDYVHRNLTNHMESKLVDEYGDDALQDGFNCSFFFAGDYLGSNDTESDGHCHLFWNPQCGLSLQSYEYNVSISDPEGFYSIGNGTNSTVLPILPVYDQLNITVTDPAQYSIVHRGESTDINSSVNDSCELCGPSDFEVNWTLNWKRSMNLTVYKQGGYEPESFPVTVNSSYLESQGIDIWDWPVSYTRVMLDGQEVSSRVNSWNDSNKTAINWSQESFGVNSELVFVANQSDWENLTYEITYSASNVQEDFGFIENSGFESGFLGPWSCYGSNTSTGQLSLLVCDGPYCACEIRQDVSGNHSLYLSSDDKGGSFPSVQGAGINSGYPLGYERIKVRYNFTGEFDNTTGDAYLRVYAGNGSCDLDITDSLRNTWQEQVCYNESFSEATWINITAHDYGFGGGGLVDASHVYIDSICLADANGSCVNYHSGYMHTKSILSQDTLGSGKDTIWSMPVTEPLGIRKLMARASGSSYLEDETSHYLYVYGWSGVSLGNISSSNCTYNGSWSCMKNATLDFYCFVYDQNTSGPVEGHNMSFWGNDQYLGSSLTDSSGKALFNWADSVDTVGNHTIKCNVTDDGSVFYNATANNTAETFFLIETGNTTALLDTDLVPVTPAEGLARDQNRTYTLFANLTNNGTTNSMFSISIDISSPSGVHPSPVTCTTLLPQETCNLTSYINVTYEADEGLKDIYVNVTWVNADVTPDNISSAENITVMNSTILNITETSLNYTIPRGGSFQAGTFTIVSYGNTDLSGIEINVSGGDEENISQWVSFVPGSVSSIAHMGEQSVSVFLDVPDNATERSYVTNITANATGSVCSPSGLCSDWLEFIVNVSVHDWVTGQEEINKTIGLMPFNGTIGVIQVINQKSQGWSFNVSYEGNISSYLALSDDTFSVDPEGSYGLSVYHRTSQDYVTGNYTGVITIENNEDAVPGSRNVSVWLEVINLSMRIVSPNGTDPTSPLYAGDLVNITLNATLSGDPDVLEGNMTWSARVGGVSCGGVQGAYNITEELWSLMCTAPQLEGNPIYNDLEVTGVYTPMSATLTVTEVDAVVYADIAPPVVNDIWVHDADQEGNVEYGTKSEIAIRANITDNTGVTSAWAELYYQDASQGTYQMYNISEQVWTFNFSSPLSLGDYNAVVFANDSGSNINSTNTTVMGYFDIYSPIDMNGSLTYKDGSPIDATYRLYKNGTSWEIHSFSTNSSGHYKWVVHRRVYDVKVGFSGQEITLYGVDMNASAVDQHGVTDPENVTDPLTLDMFTINSSDITNVVLPDGAANKIMVIGIEHGFTRTSGDVYFSLDYTEALSEMTPGERSALTEKNFGIYRCPSWDMPNRVCNGSDFLNESISVEVDEAGNTISFTTSGTSAYALAEWEGVEDDGTGDDDSTPPGSSSSSSSSSSPSGTTPSTSLPFSATTSIGNIRIHPGENKTYLLSIKNKVSSNITVSLEIQGLEDFIFPEKSLINITYNSTETIDVVVSVPENMGTGTYTGSMIVSSGSRSQEIPITMTVSVDSSDLVSLGIDILTPNINPGGKLRFAVDIRNIGLPQGFNVSMVYMIKESERERVIKEERSTVFLENALMFTKTMEMSEPDLKIGQYYLEVWAYFGDGQSVNKVAVFNMVEPYWSSFEGRIILLSLSLAGIGIFMYYGIRRYRAWKREKSRYIFPLDFKKLPRKGGDSFWIGRIAESDKEAWFNPSDLTTHLIVAGSTGAGKSVSASVFVEEALDRKIPVVVFDPTAQWTGFVKALEDDNIKRYYPGFGMDPKSVRPFKGMIFEVTDPQQLLFDIKQGFDRYLSPGEITVFTMDKLKPGQYDEAVSTIIDALFQRSWEESTSLKMIVVFDEVHRLLEKYGGKGGYIALEKAAREFRKWGIGMIMCSQVLADFKEAIAGNVLTEVQLNTKSMTDIQKVATKYGEEYSRKISRQGVGVGMIQNPKYNDGKPYFIQFRPTWHNPHKISSEDLEMYKKFAKRLETVEATIQQIKKSGKDTFDIELELRLAKDKLKQGRFRMAQIYITSLEQHLNIKASG